MRRLSGLLFAIGLVLWGGSPNPPLSQVGASNAQLNGTVRDESGGSVPKAAITVRELDTNRTYTAVSNDNGLYVIANLPPGHYELTTEAAGFGRSTQTGVVLTVGQVATVDGSMKVGPRAAA